MFFLLSVKMKGVLQQGADGSRWKQLRSSSIKYDNKEQTKKKNPLRVSYLS